MVLGLANGPGTGAEKYGPIIFVHRQLLWDYNEYEYLDTELGIDSIGMVGLDLWSQRFLCESEKGKKM